MNFCSSFLTHQQPALAESTLQAGQLVIRTADFPDLHSLAGVLTDSFHSGEGLMVWFQPLLKLGIYEDLRTRLRSRSPHYLCLVALLSMVDGEYKSDQIAGTVEMTLRYASQATGGVKYPYIANLAVQEQQRRQGIASKLMAHCDQTALIWGFRDIYLHVLEDNEQAKQLYLNCGYRFCHLEPSYLACLFKRPRRLLMHKHL